MSISNLDSPHSTPQEEKGATANERLLFASKQDSEEIFDEVDEEGGYDINYKDGLGNTALHYAVMNRSFCVLDMLLEQEGVDVDLYNNQGQTPILSAIEIQGSEARLYAIKTLLESGADPRIRNSKTGQKPLEILLLKIQADGHKDAKSKSMDDETVAALRQAEAEMSLDPQDVANDSDQDQVDSDDVASD